MIGAVATGVNGMLRAAERFERAADGVARSGVEPDGSAADRAQEIGAVVEAETDFALNAAVVRAARGMTGQLLDVLA